MGDSLGFRRSSYIIAAMQEQKARSREERRQGEN